MRRSLGVIGITVCLWLLAGTVWSQGLGVPGGRWWERPRLAAALGLTDEQRSKLEVAATASARIMIDLKANVEKAELDLKAAADEQPLNAAKVRQAFAVLQQVRTRLDAERFEMLLKVREVLTVEQWRSLQELRRERQRESGAGREPGAAGREDAPRQRHRP
jgi:Spy/CpxP family protein refolding chaperone